MGTMITLDVGGMSVDGNKNARGTDHGALFQMGDRRRTRSDQINYDSIDPDDPDLAEMEMAFTCRLADLIPRLELMGFGLDTVETAYRRAAAASRGDHASFDEEDHDDFVEPMCFAEFRHLVKENPIEELDDTFVSGFETGFRQQIEDRIAANNATERIPFYGLVGDGYSERSHFGNLLSFLHPYGVLRLLAESPANHDAQVVWQYGPLVTSGWAEVYEFEPCARRTQTFLIATEGRSDTLILKHALALLRPDIADFFKFVDMRKGFPFRGTGNLKNFASGLTAIDVQNQVLFLLDNDAEGINAQTEIESMGLPDNMRATCLPNQSDLRAVPCRGPEGLQLCDINGRAAAIECYLDLAACGQPPAEVRWLNYKEPLDCYHGALQAKKHYTRNFLEQTHQTLTDGTYDTSKISCVLDHIFSVCSQIAAQTNLWFLESEHHYRW